VASQSDCKPQWVLKWNVAETCHDWLTQDLGRRPSACFVRLRSYTTLPWVAWISYRQEVLAQRSRRSLASVVSALIEQMAGASRIVARDGILLPPVEYQVLGIASCSKGQKTRCSDRIWQKKQSSYLRGCSRHSSVMTWQHFGCTSSRYEVVTS
jgi:hypothetical protein